MTICLANMNENVQIRVIMKLASSSRDNVKDNIRYPAERDMVKGGKRRVSAQEYYQLEHFFTTENFHSETY